MGTYCELYIADYPVLSCKSSVEPIVMALFREPDKRVYTRRVCDRNPITWGHLESGPDEVETVVEYRISVPAARDRLRVMGYDAHRFQRDFLQAKAQRLEWLAQFSEDRKLNPFDDEIALLRVSTFDDFLEAYHLVLATRLASHDFLERNPGAPPLVRHVLRHDDELIFGFPSSDLRCCLGALVWAAPESATVIQDITDLVDSGYYDVGDEVSNLALAELKGDYPSTSRVIVLTEGVTDAEVLQGAMGALYPHLVEYYSFMDLAMRAPGGAGTLANVVKSFAAARIENRVIALFDNDTAGRSAASSLAHLCLPENFRVLHYPDLELARSYPAYGPAGLAVQDINGLACSIELFFGADVLTVEGGLVPIQWKGYDERLHAYQGEIMRRDVLKSAFLKKLVRARTSIAASDANEWVDMNLLLGTIFDAFNT